jgi:hypothetical protein
LKSDRETEDWSALGSGIQVAEDSRKIQLRVEDFKCRTHKSAEVQMLLLKSIISSREVPYVIALIQINEPVMLWVVYQLHTVGLRKSTPFDTPAYYGGHYCASRNAGSWGHFDPNVAVNHLFSSLDFIVQPSTTMRSIVIHHFLV